ncbi:hypothetical protein [Halorarum halophilum]|nr:hypothetical protein [Halobaculum halophilum]
MGTSVETGAVTQRPEDLRQDGQCVRCGAEVEAADDEHECDDHE